MHIVSHIAITHNEWPNEHYKYMKTCVQKHMKIAAFFFMYNRAVVLCILFYFALLLLLLLLLVLGLLFAGQFLHYCLHRIHQFIFESSAEWSFGYNVVYADALSYRQLFSRHCCRHCAAVIARVFFLSTTLWSWSPVSSVWHLRESAPDVSVLQAAQMCLCALALNIMLACVDWLTDCVYVCEFNIP